MDHGIITTIGNKYRSISRFLSDERSRRVWAATEAASLGRGGISAVSLATGIGRRSIRKGIQELHSDHPLPFGRIRSSGGGREKSTAQDTPLLQSLDALVEPVTRVDLERPLRWTCPSGRTLAAELRLQGHPVSHHTVGRLLKPIYFLVQPLKGLSLGAVLCRRFGIY